MISVGTASMIQLGTSTFICTACGNEFHSKAEAECHLCRHCAGKRQSCRHCAGKPPRCRHCADKSDPCQHCAGKPPRFRHCAGKPHVCITCGKAVLNLGNLKKHQLRHVPLSERPRCVGCGARFLTRRCLLRHVDGSFQHRRCTICGAVHRRCRALPSDAAANPTVVKNVAAENAPEDKQTLSEIRRPRSSVRAASETARRSCSQITPFVENIAAESPAEDKQTLSEIRRPRVRVASETGRRSCSQKTAVTGPLGNHISRPSSAVEGGRSRRNGARVHECPVCRKVLPSRGNLVRHFRQHTGERPYSCPDCGRTFVDQGNMKKHSLVHRRPRSVDASRLPPVTGN